MADRRLAAAAALTLLAGCGAPHALLAPEVAVVAPAQVAESAGFDALGPEDAEVAWRVGDRALYEITYNEPAGRRVWFVEARYADPGPAAEDEHYFSYTWNSDDLTVGERFALSTVELRVSEVGEEELDVIREGAPLRLFQRGLYDACDRFAALFAAYEGDVEDVEVSADDQRALADGMFSLFSVLRIVKDVEELRDVLYTIVEKPSLVSVVLNLGVDLGISAQLDVSEAVAASLPAPLEDVPAYQFPAELRLNGDLALHLSIRACPPRPPLHAFAGITYVRCTHPEEPERWMEIRQIGARRGGAARP